MAASRPRNGSGSLALGAWLAARGRLAGAGIALCVAGALGSIIVAVASGGGDVARLPLAESSVITWSGGVLLAFASAVHAVRRDRDQGVLALLRARGASVSQYVRGRVGGLVLVLAAALGGATLVGGLAATAVAHPVLGTVRASLAAVAYAVAFAATVGPVAMATLGARNRAGGLFALLSVLVVPELLSPWTAGVLPRGWHELTSIPAALAAVRAGVAAPSAMGLPMARALAGLVAVIALSLVVVAARVRHADAGRST
jgi:hypothetical protein